MNEPIENAPECCEELKNYVREHPGRVVLAAVGAGLLLAALLRKPARPEHRAIQILEDIQDRLKDISKPMYRRAVSAADRGAALVKEGIEHLDDLDLPSSCGSISRKLKNLFR